VATDIAARGLDIPLLPYVINFELPNIAEDYVHRIGRTARAGASGEAISFVSQDEKAYLRDIEKLLKQSIPSSILEGFEPNEEEEVVVAKAPDKRNSNNKKRSQYFRNR
jgi:ATP-dependent RNA helicase RhlE